jgi:hypothetical protein
VGARAGKCRERVDFVGDEVERVRGAEAADGEEGRVGLAAAWEVSVFPAYNVYAGRIEFHGHTKRVMWIHNQNRADLDTLVFALAQLRR